MTHLFFDCETAPIADAATYLPTPSAPSNYKDEAKIAAYVEEKRAEEVARAALDVDLCRVVALAWTDEDGAEVAMWCRDAEEERQALAAFWLAVTPPRGVTPPLLVGFNCIGFDLPVLMRRSLYLGVPHTRFDLRKYGTRGIEDLMVTLSHGGLIRQRSLSFYAQRLGLPHTDPVRGKDIGALVESGDWDAVLDHCRADVQLTRALALRIGIVRERREATA